MVYFQPCPHFPGHPGPHGWAGALPILAQRLRPAPVELGMWDELGLLRCTRLKKSNHPNEHITWKSGETTLLVCHFLFPCDVFVGGYKLWP